MDDLILKKIDEIKELANKFGLVLLILFGSRSSNFYDKKSDYDFAYFSRKPLSKLKKKMFLNSLEKLFSYERVDLIEINTSDSIILRNEIFEKGICLYELKDGLFDEFAGNSWIDYMDNLTYLKDYKKNIVKSVKSM